CTEQRHPCRSTAPYFEAVRKVPRPENVRTRSGDRPLAIAHESHFAVEHIKCFVLEMMGVVRGLEPWWHHLLHQPECTVGGLRRRPKDSRESQKVDWRFL